MNVTVGASAFTTLRFRSTAVASNPGSSVNPYLRRIFSFTDGAAL